MQGVIVTPSSDVWVVGISKSQLVYFPKGDLTKGRIVCEGREVEPCKSFVGPFHLGIDQQDRIWVTNAFGAHVTRFPASDPTKVEKFKTGYSGSGLGIDSQGNVWVTNRLGNSDRGMFDIVEDIAVLKTGGNADRTLTYQLSKQKGGPDGGSRHAATARWYAIPRLAVHGWRSSRSVDGDNRRQRQCLGLQFCHAEQPDHSAVWHQHGELPARL